MKIIHKTESLCPVCLKKLDAVYERDNDQVYIRKCCPEHGESRVLFWRDADMYERWMEQGIHAPKIERNHPEKKGCPYDCGLCDEHQSGTCTTILEITSRCNMHCPICFADADGQGSDLPQETIRNMYAAAVKANRCCSVQLSGGEPTVRDDLPEIVQMGRDIGVFHLQVNTNGIRIAEDIEYLRALKETGADLIYLQFDGTREDIYQKTRGRDMLEIKRKAIENCREIGIGVILVPVVTPRVNLDNVGSIIYFAKDYIPTVKGVHFQPLSYFGRYPGEVPADGDRCGLCDVIHALQEQTNGMIREECFVPRKQFDPHCDFSSTYFLDESGDLIGVSHFNQNENDTEETDFVAKTNEFTKKRWRINEETGVLPTSSLRRFALRTLTHSFVISGMGFQDAWNVDIGRLKGCCVHVVTPKGELIPFCAYHITSTLRKRLY